MFKKALSACVLTAVLLMQVPSYVSVASAEEAYDFTKSIASEDFQSFSGGSAYKGGNNWSFTLDANKDSTAGTATVREESNGNKYLNLAVTDGSNFDIRFSNTFTKSDRVIMLSMDYRAATAQVGIYDSASAVSAQIVSEGMVIKNHNGTALTQVGKAISTKTDDEYRWVNCKFIFVPTKKLVHIYVDNQFWGTSPFRNSAANTLTSFWIGFRGSDKSVDIDNISLTDLHYILDEKDRLTFDSGNTKTFTHNGQGDASMAYVSDGVFKMVYSEGTNGPKQYSYKLPAAISGLCVLSFDYKMKVDNATNGFFDVYLLPGNLGTINIYKNVIKSYNGTQGRENVVSNVNLNDGNWHNFQIIADTDTDKLRFVHDYTTVVTKEFDFRSASTKFSELIFRANPQNTADEFYIDNVVFYQDAGENMVITLASDVIDINNTEKTIKLAKADVRKYSPMSTIAADISSNRACTFGVDDSDASGGFSNGDILLATEKNTGIVHKYEISITEDITAEVQALIVKGTDGQGDDYCRDSKITKAGTAETEYRIENITGSVITPMVMAAVYDDNGNCTDLDVAQAQNIAPGEYADFITETVIGSNVSNGRLKLFIWQDSRTLEPVISAKEYIIDTDDFTVPNIISDGMVLQRNDNVNIFGNAPEGATVTVSLSGDDGYNNTAVYTVPEGSNEYCAQLTLGEYSNEGKTLTISAADGSGNVLGSCSVNDILIGDVYYGAGQSNMARSFSNFASEIQAGKCSGYEPADYDQYVADYTELGNNLNNVRYFTTFTHALRSRNVMTEKYIRDYEKWETVTGDNIGTKSETMVRTVAAMQSLSDANRDVPVGIIFCAQGGTKLAKWVSRDSILSSDMDQAARDEYESNLTDPSHPEYWASHTDFYYDGARTVMPYTLKAAIWYQGEADTSDIYDKYLKAMISDYRAGFKNNGLPYLIVQLPGYVAASFVDGVSAKPASVAYANRRLYQWNAAQQLDNVYTVVSNDTGDNSNIHPADKAILCERLARTMLSKVFGETDIVCEGPEFEEIVSSDAGTVTIRLTKAVQLYDSMTKYHLFQVKAGGNWYTIDADSIAAGDTITANGNTITINTVQTTEKISDVRYAYGPAVVRCVYGLYDGIELPLVPFDTTYIPNNLNQ